MNLQGYVRPDGSVGFANHVVILPTVACANSTAGRIARGAPGALALSHAHGCGRAMEIELHRRTLAGLGLNPNVAAVLVVGLGCETIPARELAEDIAVSGKPVEYLCIQEEGGSQKTARRGMELTGRLLAHADTLRRSPCGMERLTVGLQCGGSDAFSGITANPATGIVTDRLVERGATVILTETTEMIGTTHILKRRAADPETASRLEQIIAAAHARTHDILGPLAGYVIAPGNMDGGMSSIREKSLGCIIKGGTAPISAVTDYGMRPPVPGLVVMDGPGYDCESLPGLAAAGCQLMLFTTGRGTPAGCPVAPVIKIASTSRLFAHMNDDLDINAGVVVDGTPLDEVADAIEDLMHDVLAGRRTRCQLNDQDGMLCLPVHHPAF